MIVHSLMGIEAKKTALIVVNDRGLQLALQIKSFFNEPLSIFMPEKIGHLYKDSLIYNDIKLKFKEIFGKFNFIVAIMATGIVVRAIAPLVKSKQTDPAVVVIDESGHFAISLIGGHEAGGNKLACLMASLSDGEPVITTGSEVNKKYIIGLGFRKSTLPHQLKSAILKACEIAGINHNDIRYLATIKRKLNDESFYEVVRDFNVLFRCFDENTIKNMNYSASVSKAAVKHLNIPGVAQPSAILAADCPEIILPATNIDGIIVSVVKDRK